MATTTSGTSFGSQEKNTGTLGLSQESRKVAKLITNSEELYPSELTITDLTNIYTGAQEFSRRQGLAEGRMELKCHSPNQTPPLLQSACTTLVFSAARGYGAVALLFKVQWSRASSSSLQAAFGLTQLYSACTSTKLFSRIFRKCITSPFSVTVMTSGSGSLKDTSARLWQCWAQTQRTAAASARPSAAVQTRRMPSWAARSRGPLPGPSPFPGTADSGAGLVTHGRVFPSASCSSLSSSPPVPASSGCGASSLSAICLEAEDKLLAALASPNQAVVAAVSPRRRNEKLFLTWHLISWEVEGHVGVDSDVVVVGAVQLHPQVPGHHVGAGGKARALREGGRVGDQAQCHAGPANNGSVGSPTILHPTAGNNVQFTSKQWLPEWCH
ncbi:PREDICTED: uncharacterized protein LOC108449105 [Corvus brachyrhynchos]|uniref:uncharacterized protein LOC108449105 n=1 Tax=Corvus brachyrhynchos TaxID=85066 RepID=UPI0008166468|nr:PREDICTED: uncharacterized protein LOC108449105 [Corvus brachyrhynchos]XP_017599668.1 PREDICTED: uncharacterized protein LOC108449105 [Corvus brachyrhynchos]